MPQKIVINACFGGFSLSEHALEALRAKGHKTEYAYVSGFEDDRSHPDLVEVVELLGPLASGGYAELKVVEVPDGVEWTIEEYDGNEWVAEKHRTWS